MWWWLYVIFFDFSEISFPSSTFIYILLIMWKCKFFSLFLCQYILIYVCNLGKWVNSMRKGIKNKYTDCLFEKQRQCGMYFVQLQSCLHLGTAHSTEMTSLCFSHELIFPLYIYSTANKTEQFYLFLMSCQWTYC